MNKLIKYGLFIFCVAFLWGKTDKAMATCGLTSALSSVTINQNFTFTSNKSNTSANESPNTTFWSGSANETYSCPAPSKNLYFCQTDNENGTYVAGGTSTILAPGIKAWGVARNGSTSAGNYSGCYGILNGNFPAKGNLPSGLLPWIYAGARVAIFDSTQARNITVNNVLVGTIFLTTEDYGGKAIGGSPLTKIYISGTITIPASCTLSSSSVVVLPDTYSGEYSKAGTSGKIGTGTTAPMSIKCLGGSETATIDLHVTTNKTSGDDIVTSNPDVGVRVLDGNGNTVSANNGKYSATLSGGNVDVPFTYVPVSTTGKNPEPGDYSAIETITVTIP